jgi:hypothetical protein
MAIPILPDSYLMVPMKLDTLFVSSDNGGLPVVGPFADFSQLPYRQGNNPFNYDRPYISETVLTPPFLDRNHRLLPGMHLHWALPDALTKASYHNNLEFPVCPNRWVVLKFENEIETNKWMVCSDYLWPAGTDIEQKEMMVCSGPGSPFIPPISQFLFAIRGGSANLRKIRLHYRRKAPSCHLVAMT